MNLFRIPIDPLNCSFQVSWYGIENTITWTNVLFFTGVSEVMFLFPFSCSISSVQMLSITCCYVRTCVIGPRACRYGKEPHWSLSWAVDCFTNQNRLLIPSADHWSPKDMQTTVQLLAFMSIVVSIIILQHLLLPEDISLPQLCHNLWRDVMLWDLLS